MTDPVAIDARAATALVAAAAASVTAEEAPNAAAWERAVMGRAFALLRIVPAVVEKSELLASCRTVPGVLAKVEEVKGRGVITSHATIGSPQRGQEVFEGRPVEHFRTGFLNTPEGRAMYELAQSLVGRHCRFTKWVDTFVDGAGQAGKVNMLEAIEDLGPDPLTVNNTSTPTSSANGQRRPVANEPSQAAPSRPERPARSPGSVTRPSREDVARAGREAAERDARRLGGAGEGDWYVANGWRDQAQADSTRAALVAALEEAPGLVNVDVMAYARAKGLDWGVAWSADETLLVQAKLRSKLDEMAQGERPALRAVSAGGAAADYSGYSDEPF